jgi:spore coat polysaccharide biosynthesis protein SpsF
MQQKIGIIIQARLGSTRLPNKILLPAKGKPLFQIQVDRLKKINVPLYIATTTNQRDIEIIEFSASNNILYFTGDEENVLQRYYGCAAKFGLDVIIRITSDCPLIDADLIKTGLEEYLEEKNQDLYLSNVLERTFPRGFDFEIFSFKLLEEAFTNAVDQADKEHVTPFIWKNKGGNVVLKHKVNKEKNSSKYRVTLDTQDDYVLIKKLIEDYNADVLTGEEIIAVLDSDLSLSKINEHIEQKKI